MIRTNPPQPLSIGRAAAAPPPREERLRAGELWEDNGLVFCQPNGRPIDPRRDWDEWQQILRDAGLEDAGTHVMRHAAATLMLDLGVDLAVVQEVLGHADLRTTLAKTKVKVGLIRRAAKKVDRALFKPRPATDLATSLATRRRAGNG
jgi:integrase